MSPPPPAQDPWLLTFYTVPELERGFAAWHSARFAQVNILHTSRLNPSLWEPTSNVSICGG